MLSLIRLSLNHFSVFDLFGGGYLEFLAHDSYFDSSSLPVILLFFFLFVLSLLPKIEEKDKETRVSRNAALNLPPALCGPAGENRENSKHGSPAKTKKRTAVPLS